MMQLVSEREDLRLQGITGPKTGRDQSEKGDEKRAHRGSHHHLTNDRNPCVFRSDGVFGNHGSLFPDGSKMALMDDQSDNVNMRVFDLQSKQVQVIHPTPPQKLLQKLAWSSDGKRIFLSGIAENGNGRLLEMDLSGNTHLLLKNPWAGSQRQFPRPTGSVLLTSISFLNPMSRSSNISDHAESSRHSYKHAERCQDAEA